MFTNVDVIGGRSMYIKLLTSKFIYSSYWIGKYFEIAIILYWEIHYFGDN